jgi:hypothetical protein
MKLQKGVQHLLAFTRVPEPTMPKYTRRTLKNNAQTISRKLKKLPKHRTFAYMGKEDRITEALKAYHDPEQPDISSMRIAACVFDIPYSTLNDRNKGANTLSENGGRNSRLNEAQEASLIWYMDAAIERGFPLRYDMITAAAATILKNVGDNRRLGVHWARRWVEKQQKLGRYHAVCTKPMDYKGKDSLTPELVMEYFDGGTFVKEEVLNSLGHSIWENTIYTWWGGSASRDLT